MPADQELNVKDWSQLHISIQWVYRGAVSDQGRGHFPGGCGVTAWYLLRGEGWVRHDDCERRARVGDWLFPNTGAHYRNFSTDAEILSLRCYIEWPDGQPFFPLRESICIPGAQYPDLLRRARVMERVVNKSGKQSYSSNRFMHERLGFSAYLDIEVALFHWSKALYHAFISEGVSPSLERFEDERVARILRVLDGWPLHMTFSQKQLVQQVGISRAQLDRLLTAKLGQTAHHYFDRRRLHYAERKLATQPTKEVAFDLGFRHVSSFSAWFKRKTGANPNERR